MTAETRAHSGRGGKPSPTTMRKTFTIAAIVVVGLALIGAAVYSGKPSLGNVAYEIQDFREGVYSGVARQFSIGRTGNVVTAGTLTATTSDVRVKNPVQTGTITNIASSSAITLTAAQVCDSSVITQPDWTPITSSTATMTLPTAAALYADCLTTNGDTYSFTIRNLHATAGSSTAVIANTSTTLVGPTANDDIINGANEAVITLIRYSAAEMLAVIREQVAAD